MKVVIAVDCCCYFIKIIAMAGKSHFVQATRTSISFDVYVSPSYFCKSCFVDLLPCSHTRNAIFQSLIDFFNIEFVIVVDNAALGVAAHIIVKILSSK